MIGQKDKRKWVVVAICGTEIVAGTVYSVVLKRIGVTARKLGSARLNSAGGVPVVKSVDGKAWSLHRVELLSVRGRKGGPAVKRFA